MLHPEMVVYAPVTEVEAESSISAGIRMQALAAGLVPVYEEHQARRGAGYTIPEWRGLDWIDRAIEVALFRIENAVKAHHADVEKKAIEKASRK